jgi:hypothetical protein
LNILLDGQNVLEYNRSTYPKRFEPWLSLEEGRT